MFDEDSYIRSFDAVVTACRPKGEYFLAALDRTAFYPEGGGQPGDTGMLFLTQDGSGNANGGLKVLDTIEREGEIFHKLESPVDVGTRVHGEIDWDRRFSLMQNHSGEHIVSGLIHETFGYENVGFHMGETIQVDYSGMLSDEEIREVERKANEIIWTNQPVIITYPSEEERENIPYRSKKELSGTVRIVTVLNADICACCGTHVKTAGEVGLIKIISHEKHKGGIRMELLCGRRAFDYVCMLHDQNHDITVRLCTPMNQTAEGTRKLEETMQEKSRHLAEMTALYLQDRAEKLEKSELVIDVLKGIDRNSMRRYADDLVKVKGCGTAAVLNRSDNGPFEYVIITSKDIGLRKLAKDLNGKLQGRGGGSDEMIQGTFSASEEEIRLVLQEIFAA